MTRLTSKGTKSSMHNYATKIRNHEKRWVQMQDTVDELTIKRTTKQSHIHIHSYENFRITANQKSTIYTHSFSYYLSSCSTMSDWT